MKSIIITGSTRGIGYGLAVEFLKRGCAVTINGRSQLSVDRAVGNLAEHFGVDSILGFVGDVGNADDMDALWKAAERRFNRIDIWINNAGYAPYAGKIWEVPGGQVQNTIDVNLTGLINGCAVAIRGMYEQGYGHIYNMQGLGSKGEMRKSTGIYGASKYGAEYITRALQSETKNMAISISSISPGIVITDLITGQYENDREEFEKTKRIYNILGDKVETVAPFLAEKVLANNRNKANIAWLTRRKAFGRFLSAPFRRRDLFK